MVTVVSKCGIDCGACPWGVNSRRNMAAEEFERYRNHTKRILGYMPIKTACLTCQTPDSQIPKGSHLPNRRCLIRQCVDKAGMVNCAYCSRFPCDTVKVVGGLWSRENIERKLDAPISDEEYQMFVEPFEGIRHLEAIRASLKPDEIVEPVQCPPSETRIVDFPENLPFSKEESTSFQAVHTLLSVIKRSTFGLRDTDTFAQQQRLRNQRAHVFRFLWILGRYGEFTKTNGVQLVVDARTYGDNRGSQKTLAMWAFVRDSVFKVLSEFGVRCERVALKGVKKEDLTTPTGYLRSKGWVMKMSFEKEVWDAAALQALQTYTRSLDEQYGRKAFKYFLKVDMQSLQHVS